MFFRHGHICILWFIFPHLNHNHEREESSECEHHAGIFRDGSAAAAESHNEDHDPQSDEQDGAVEVGVVQEVEVVAHLDLDVSPHGDQRHSRHEEEEVEDEDEVLEHRVATVFHREAGRVLAEKK